MTAQARYGQEGRYPPSDHVLRDLGLDFGAILRSAGSARIGLEVDAELCVAGGLRAGFLATCSDFVAGGLARKAAAPDWVATADLSLHLLRPAGPGPYRLAGEVLRAGRGSVLSRIELLAEESSEPLAAATVAYSRLEQQGREQPSVLAAAAVAPFPDASSAPAAAGRAAALAVLERIGAEIREDGSVRLELHDYIRNSLGGLQGGMSALLLDLTFAATGGARLEPGAAPAITADLAVRYLNVGRVGPFMARARVLRQRSDSVLLAGEVIDTGVEDRLVALGSATVVAVF